MIKALTKAVVLSAALMALGATIGTPAYAAERCHAASECHGFLPQLCKRCPNGRDGCAHWACVRHKCVIAYCSAR